MQDSVSRRRFLGGAVVGMTAGRAARGAAGLPQRTLGRTGVAVPVIGIGCGVSWWEEAGSEEKALAALEGALDLGVTYIDTGQSYGKGLSEAWVGRVAATRRAEVFLATKISVRDGDEALRETERGLRRLGTDRIDLLHIHNLRDARDLAAIEAKGGLLEAVYRLRDEKTARFIGITSHTDPGVLKTALERHDFDCTQMALNAALQGFAGDRPSRPAPSFEALALPAARRKNMGVIAMKVTGRKTLLGSGPGQAGAPELLRYALSLPVSVAVIGMSKMEQIRANAALARDFRPMTPAEMKEVSGRISSVSKAALDASFAQHEDA